MKKQNRFMMYIEAQERKMNVEIPQNVREEMLTFFRKEETYQRVRRYHNAFYSLDRDGGLENEISDAAPSPEEIVIRKEETQRLQSALMTLSTIQQKRIILRYLHGVPIAEIARIEGVSWSAVRRSINQGIKRLRDILLDKK